MASSLDLFIGKIPCVPLKKPPIVPNVRLELELKPVPLQSFRSWQMWPTGKEAMPVSKKMEPRGALHAILGLDDGIL